MGKFIVTAVSLRLYTVVEKRGFKELLHVLEPQYEACNKGPTTLMNCQLIKESKVGSHGPLFISYVGLANNLS